MQYTKRILLTGADGFVGRNFLEYLAKNKNIAVRAFIYEQELGQELPEIEKIRGDIRDYAALEKAFVGVPFDGIVHLAAVIKPPRNEDYTEVNIKGTRNLVRLAEINGVKKFIFLSSDFVLYENVAPNPYGASKIRSEEIISASTLDYTIFRPAPIFGPGDTKNFVSLASVIKKYPILPVIRCFMEPVYVGDVAKMIVAALEKPNANRQIYHLPGGKSYEFQEILYIISRHLGLKRLIIPVPTRIFLLALKLYENLVPNPLVESYQVRKWIKNQPLDPSKAKKDLGYNPISFKEGVRFINL